MKENTKTDSHEKMRKIKMKKLIGDKSTQNKK